MPTSTYIPLATLVLTGNDGVVSFTNIPSTYKDLRLVAVPKGNEVNSATIAINGVNTGYTRVRTYATSSSGSDLGTNNAEFFFTTTNWAVVIYDFLDYSATDRHKVWLSRSSEAERYVAATAYRYASNSAISSITLTSNPSFAWTAGATFSLYGIAG
jgi:hypothetical protein